MPDRGRANGSRSRALIPEAAAETRTDMTDASADHYWLMRRDLCLPIPSAPWPSGVLPSALTLERAPETHSLLASGYRTGQGSVPDYHTWRSAFERDPEFDLSRCFLAISEDTVAGVIICWTSAFVRDLVVHPELRNNGIGSALLNHLFAHLAAPSNTRGEAAVDLHVTENNHVARRLYEKSGMSYVRRFPLPTP
ncbi:Acetyltransferase [Pseudomonas coronafaciens pv. atropurpurea]|nr:Acetyltransferase [Pseudomonas coronafaciens pv. atropurpurea]